MMHYASIGTSKELEALPLCSWNAAMSLQPNLCAASASTEGFERVNRIILVRINKHWIEVTACGCVMLSVDITHFPCL